MRTIPAQTTRNSSITATKRRQIITEIERAWAAETDTTDPKKP